MKKLLVLLFALLSAQAFGQAYSSTVLQNSAGNYGRPVPYPQVLVCSPGDTNVPCISRAATYTDDTLSTQCTQTGSSGLLIGNPTSGANCNNPGIGDVNGNFTIYVAGGEYMICTYSGTWLCLKQTIGNGGGSGSGGLINSCLGNSCDAYYPVANTPSIFGDQFATDDGAGNKTGKSFTTTQTGVAGFHYFTQGSAPLLSLNNSVYFYAPVSVSTYAWILPGSAGSGCMQASNNNGLVTISFTGTNCLTGTTTHYIPFTIYAPAGLAAGMTTASTSYLTDLPACTITAWSLGVPDGSSPTITVKFWKIANGTALPTVSNSINTSGVSLSAGTTITSTTLTDFTTTTVSAKDKIAMNITAVSGSPTYVNGELECQ